MKILEWILWTYLFVKSTSGEKIQCSKECKDVKEVCKVYSVQESFWSNENEKTAPKPHNVNIKIFRKKSRFWLRIVWSQKASQMEYVDAYLIKIISTDSDQVRKLKVDIKRDAMMRNVSSPEVTFEYSCYHLSNPRSGTMYIVRIFALPLYQPDSDDLCGKAQVEFKRGRYRIRRRSTVQSILRTVPATAKTSQKLVKTSEQISETTSSNNDTATTSLATDMDDVTAAHIIIIGVLSILGTILLLVISTVLYIAACRGLRVFYKQGKRRTHKSVTAQQQKEKKNRVTVVGSTMDRDNFYTDLTLSLANTLNSLEGFQVSCNLWMLKEISRIGIGVWAHNIIKASENVIITCNPYTVNTIQKVSSCQENIVNADMAAQLILNGANELSKFKVKLIIVCADPRKHACLWKQLPCSQIHESITLPGNFSKLIEVLVPHKKKYLPFKKDMAILHGSLTQKIWKLQQKYLVNPGNYTEHPYSLQNSVSTKQDAAHELHELQYTSTHQHEQKLKKKVINVHNMKIEEMPSGFKTISEGQYDSVYSSRCNSHSTDTISSGEDTGFHESENCYKLENYAAKFELSGARPKVTDKTFIS